MFMQRIISILAVLILSSSLVACGQVALAAQDHTGPSIGQIETSTKFMAKSDCQPTSVTITANITDESGIKQAVIWYRVGSDQQYTPVNLSLINGKYSATVKGLDVPGGEYGTWEFYLSAEDTSGNKSESPLDTSVQLLPCVG
jgi:hypothetical protein